METLNEFIPFAKEMLSQKPSRGMLKVYLVGSVFAVLGTVIGLVETVCHPFSSGEQMDAEMLFMLAREERTVEAALEQTEAKQEDEEEKEEEGKKEAHENGATTQSVTLSKAGRVSQRSHSNRLHAS